MFHTMTQRIYLLGVYNVHVEFALPWFISFMWIKHARWLAIAQRNISENKFEGNFMLDLHMKTKTTYLKNDMKKSQ